MKKYFKANNPTNPEYDTLLEKYANIWAALYLIYDEDEASMDQAFYNNGLYAKSPDELRTECLDIAKAILDMKYDYKSDTDLEPEVREMFRQAESM